MIVANTRVVMIQVPILVSGQRVSFRLPLPPFAGLIDCPTGLKPVNSPPSHAAGSAQ